jgi:5-methylcytosine-specific restriction enzyme subunit McrC
MIVPVANVYYMLLYAWSLFRERDPVDVAQEGYTELQDLFAHVLADTVADLLACGLDRGYVTRDEPVAGIRGRLELPDTLKRNLLPAGRAHCRFDELEYDVLHNRILKATLRRLQATELHEKNRRRVLALLKKLDAVADVEVAVPDFRRVQLHRNNGGYEYALRLCELIHENLMVDPRTGRTRFRAYHEREQQMGLLFQGFVREFFRRHRGEFRVFSPVIEWVTEHASPADLLRLPRMETDIVLEGAGRRIILDTKFYGQAVVGRGQNKRLIAEHLYQVFAYVQNREARVPGSPHEAMLLYPVVEAPFSMTTRSWATASPCGPWTCANRGRPSRRTCSPSWSCPLPPLCRSRSRERARAPSRWGGALSCVHRTGGGAGSQVP